MSEMTERMARAIDPDGWDPKHPWCKSYRKSRHTRARNQADAVLRAMREPTEEMLVAGFKDCFYGIMSRSKLAQAYRAMLAEALN